ncbi:hypothetical protein [Pantoea sp. SJZ147]|uniref:hypothetical protein n=1 Tax=Pantoea sp. SJZ147 TaxID=2572896 RepID=UPI0016473C27|nr:hypothetical protein [Pantoea sp. SJZ147]
MNAYADSKGAAVIQCIKERGASADKLKQASTMENEKVGLKITKQIHSDFTGPPGPFFYPESTFLFHLHQGLRKP